MATSHPRLCNAAVIAAAMRRSVAAVSRSLPYLLSLLIALVAWGVSSRSGSSDPPSAGGASAAARVTRVVDGDTIVVRLDGQRERVRYIGIDTPESVKPGVPVQCFAKAASHANEQLVAGRTVRLEFDRERRDRYGRLLAYITAPDGASVNEALLRGGYARTIVFPPNTRHRSRFAAIEREAQTRGTGLWSACR